MGNAIFYSYKVGDKFLVKIKNKRICTFENFLTDDWKDRIFLYCEIQKHFVLVDDQLLVKIKNTTYSSVFIR